MSTKLFCLDDTYLFECDATIIDAGKYDELLSYVILDQTVFYPQGGGQPSDTGLVISETGNFVVSKCFIDENGRTLHIGRYENGQLELGQKVKVEIDEVRRRLNAKIHTSAHLIDGTLKILGYNFHSIKGYCFPDGPYMEYQGRAENIEELIAQLNTALTNLILKGAEVKAKYQEGVHKGGKPNRIVTIEGIDTCPCGGTHLNNINELSKVTIKKIKNYPDSFRISFAVE